MAKGIIIVLILVIVGLDIWCWRLGAKKDKIERQYFLEKDRRKLAEAQFEELANIMDDKTIYLNGRGLLEVLERYEKSLAQLPENDPIQKIFKYDRQMNVLVIRKYLEELIEGRRDV